MLSNQDEGYRFEFLRLLSRNLGDSPDMPSGYGRPVPMFAGISSGTRRTSFQLMQAVV